MKSIVATLGLAFAAIATPAAAQQFTATSDIYTPGGMRSSYAGLSNGMNNYGVVEDGGYDAFDGFGYFENTPNALAVSRQTELLSGNTYRFFDTFTNTSGASFTGQVTFKGNLGSDSGTRVLQSGNGVSLSCEDRGNGCRNDPVLALVYGNAASAEITGDWFRARYSLTLAPGESASILNLAFLARGRNGTTAADQALALSTGADLLANPILTGLTTEQTARLVNFDTTAAVPEPSSWAMMIVGVGMVGGATRRRSSARPAAAIA